MTRVLLVGFDLDKVDYDDPSLPKGLTAEKIKAGIETGLKDLRERGCEADHCLVKPADPPDAIASTVKRQLGTGSYDCVVVGGGIRLPPKSLVTFEAIVNAIRTAAPQAAIAFNTVPEDSGEAAARWIK